MDYLSKLYGEADQIQEEMSILRSSNRAIYIRTGRLPARVTARLNTLSRQYRALMADIVEVEGQLLF